VKGLEGLRERRLADEHTGRAEQSNEKASDHSVTSPVLPMPPARSDAFRMKARGSGGPLRSIPLPRFYTRR
jgi:hypothetical protein